MDAEQGRADDACAEAELTPGEPPPAAEALPVAGAPRRRRRGTAVIVLGAVVLGIVAGGGIGFGVQHHRKPTPLPALFGATPRYPAALSSAPAAPEGSGADALMEQLLPAPPDAESVQDDYTPDGWMTLAQYSDRSFDPPDAYAEALALDYRRGAERSWSTSEQVVDMVLTQYNETATGNGARVVLTSDEKNIGKEAKSPGVPIPGTEDGRVYSLPGKRVITKGGQPVYLGSAVAVRGDVCVELALAELHPVTAEDLITLMTKQLGRL